MTRSTRRSTAAGAGPAQAARLFDVWVAHALQGLGVPSRSQIDTLRSQIDALETAIMRTGGKAETKARPKAAGAVRPPAR